MNSLYLTIKQIYFDQIANGTKKHEYREVKATTINKYFALDNSGKRLSLKQYEALKLGVGYNSDRDTMLIEVTKISVFEDLVTFHLGKILEINRPAKVKKPRLAKPQSLKGIRQIPIIPKKHSSNLYQHTENIPQVLYVEDPEGVYGSAAMSEQALENHLVNQLCASGYTFVKINCESDMLLNLKAQLEKHNKVCLSDTDFSKVLNHLNKGNVFDRAEILRDKCPVKQEDGKTIWIEFINQEFWCQNQFQITHQVSMEGDYKNRYDVTILINGLPLVQIELKKRGKELKEAFNQINRYQSHSYDTSYGLFRYIQIYIISNGVNTKYFTYQKEPDYKQTFFWADSKNQTINNLESFATSFLEPCHLAKMITKYMVLNTARHLMILRPYQFYAVEKIIDRVRNYDKNGYIWHTTGSGKTLTSFKVSQLLKELPHVHKVVFVVDRQDLDAQTQKEFNAFSDGSVDSTDNTQKLVKQLADNTKLIVTTLQKLDRAIVGQRYASKMDKIKDEKIVFIFDECHRSQFGDTHQRIRSFFGNPQMFGFTGTPILAKNAGKTSQNATTKDLFDDCLHQYVITDAIRDDNVLKFSVDYVGRYKEKEGKNSYSDIEVNAIDTQELMKSEKRLGKITDYIIAYHDVKTHSRKFTAMFCVGSVKTLIKYYQLFKQKKEEGLHNLKIATIFSYSANEEKPFNYEASGILEEEEEVFPSNINKHSRDHLDNFILDYNQNFNTKYSTKDGLLFQEYKKDIARRVRNKEIDILLVVNMFLTGFDSKSLNTLYVDKNLQFHGLIQAFSRTNRVLGELKSQGNVVCFRNLKEATDEAVALFSDKEAKEQILIKTYEEYIQDYNKIYEKLTELAPTADAVAHFEDENQQLEFVMLFRDLMRVNNILTSFTDFDAEDIELEPQEFNDYKGAYLDLAESTRKNTEPKVSVLNDIDFELELIHRDEINVSYIINLLGGIIDKGDEENKIRQITDLISGDVNLRSKRELILKFINENYPQIKDKEMIQDEFDTYLETERIKSFDNLAKEESIDPEKLNQLLENFLYSPISLDRDTVLKYRNNSVSITQRKIVGERIINKIKTFVETFINGV